MASLSELAEQARQALSVALAPDAEPQRDLKRSGRWPLERIDREFAAKSAYLRALLKL